ncbi:hypothetical protein L1F30_02965 [Simiduia sp. 21SJ11W-1]|uniref:hypothetical protein n=1 Tax=Simiduia sp. 21SJ11W-1 TaxID=2909669 RepID=UPI00209CF5FE|nr:hypothetical protein [Simiduia sp. 21SJ11W-1]UTA48515.1 hypothetical protein L1F30_02965 [Simiduia sp. 21SJ11W-1]
MANFHHKARRKFIAKAMSVCSVSFSKVEKYFVFFANAVQGLVEISPKSRGLAFFKAKFAKLKVGTLLATYTVQSNRVPNGPAATDVLIATFSY